MYECVVGAMSERLTKEELEKLQDTSRKSLKFLCKVVMGYKDWSENKDLHDAISYHIKKPSKFKLFLIPRDHLKSSIITKGGAIQRLLNNPNIRILIANNTWDNARKFLGSIQMYLASGTFLSQWFGNFQDKNKIWNKDEIVIRQRTMILDAPTIATTGLEKEQTSQHYDLIIADDLVARENVATADQRSKVKDYINSLMALLEPNGELWVVGTRWSQDDAYGDLIEEGIWDVMQRSCFKDGDNTQPIFPEKFTMEKLQFFRAKMGPVLFSCLPAEAPVLMSNFTLKRIADIKAGDEVIGWTNGGEKDSRLIRSKVSGIFSREQEVFQYGFESGNWIRCTDDHKWYTGRLDKSHKRYLPPKIGRSLLRVNDAQEDVVNSPDWIYLAGLFDGEGSCGSGGCLTIAQSEKANPDVFEKIKNVLQRLDIEYSLWEKKDNFRGSVFVLKNSRRVARNLIRFTDVGKKNRLINWLYKYGSHWSCGEDKVVSCYPVGRKIVYGMQTETGNYVAWGYASSNCWYLNNPISEEAADFKKDQIKFYVSGTPHPSSLYLAVDPAMSLGKDADYSAGVVGGMFADRRIRIVDYFKKRLVPSDLIAEIFRMVEKWRLHRVGVESFMFQKTLHSFIKEKQRETRKFFSIEELGRRNTGRGENILSKEARIRLLQPYFEQGLIEIRSDMTDLVDELLSFPRGKNDDLIDATAWLLQKLNPSVGMYQPSETGEQYNKDTGKYGWTMGHWVKNFSQKPGPATIYEKFFADMK